MAKTYTEDELRGIISAKSLPIIKGVYARLEDDNLFKRYDVKLTLKCQADGSFLVSDTNASEIVREAFTLFVSEFISELMVTLFEEDTV